MMNFFKAGCLGIYLLAVLSVFLTLPWGSGPLLQKLALVLIAVHALESVFAFKYIKTYPGPLHRSLALALLFGLLHWMPLAKASKAARPT